MSDRRTGPKSGLQAQQTKRRLRELAFSFLGILDGICHKKRYNGIWKADPVIFLHTHLLVASCSNLRHLLDGFWMEWNAVYHFRHSCVFPSIILYLLPKISVPDFREPVKNQVEGTWCTLRNLDTLWQSFHRNLHLRNLHPKWFHFPSPQESRLQFSMRDTVYERGGARCRNLCSSAEGSWCVQHRLSNPEC